MLPPDPPELQVTAATHNRLLAYMEAQSLPMPDETQEAYDIAITNLLDEVQSLFPRPTRANRLLARIRLHTPFEPSQTDDEALNWFLDIAGVPQADELTTERS